MEILNESVQQFLSIGIVGVGMSLIIEFIKNKLGTTSFGTKLLTVLMALILGAGYYLLTQTSYVEVVFQILTAATLFYAFFMKK